LKAKNNKRKGKGTGGKGNWEGVTRNAPSQVGGERKKEIIGDNRGRGRNTKRGEPTCSTKRGGIGLLENKNSLLGNNERMGIVTMGLKKKRRELEKGVQIVYPERQRVRGGQSPLFKGATPKPTYPPARFGAQQQKWPRANPCGLPWGVPKNKGKTPGIAQSAHQEKHHKPPGVRNPIMKGT